MENKDQTLMQLEQINLFLIDKQIVNVYPLNYFILEDYLLSIKITNLSQLITIVTALNNRYPYLLLDLKMFDNNFSNLGYEYLIIKAKKNENTIS